MLEYFGEDQVPAPIRQIRLDKSMTSFDRPLFAAFKLPLEETAALLIFAKRVEIAKQVRQIGVSKLVRSCTGVRVFRTTGVSTHDRSLDLGGRYCSGCH